MLCVREILDTYKCLLVNKVDMGVQFQHEMHL